MKEGELMFLKYEDLKGENPDLTFDWMGTPEEREPLDRLVDFITEEIEKEHA